MTEIEKTEGEIKVLQAKLELLKEMEKHKSPVEEAYKDWWGQYPELETDSEYDEMRWQGFRAGYHFAYKEKVVEEEPKPKTLYDVIYEWKYDTYDPTCDDLVNMIEEWLVDEFEYEYGNGDYDKGWNDALCTIKGKLR